MLPTFDAPSSWAQCNLATRFGPSVRTSGKAVRLTKSTFGLRDSPEMDFVLSEDQLALRSGAADVLDDLASPARVRAHTATTAPYDTALWTAMVEQGWLGVELADSDGGLGLGAVEVAVL